MAYFFFFVRKIFALSPLPHMKFQENKKMKWENRVAGIDRSKILEIVFFFSFDCFFIFMSIGFNKNSDNLYDLVILSPSDFSF